MKKVFLAFIFNCIAVLAQTPCAVMPIGPIPSNCLPPSTVYVNSVGAVGNINLGIISPAGVAPTATASGSGTLTGTFYYAVAFVSVNGGDSGIGAVSASVTASSNSVSLTSIPLGPPSTVARNLYRTYANGSTYLMHLVTTIADNVTTTFTDNTPDSALGSLMGIVNKTGGSFGAQLYPGSAFEGGNVFSQTWIAPFNQQFFNCTVFFVGPCIVIGSAGSNPTQVMIPGGQVFIPFTPATSLIATPSSTGGTIPAGTYWYSVCVGDGASGRSCSPEISVTTSGSTSSVALSWSGPSSAPFYQVFKRSTSGTLSAGYVGGTSLTDTGANVTSTGAFPDNSGARNFWIDSNGIIHANGKMQVTSIAASGLFQGTLTTPASSSAACTPAQFADDANYHYVCTATNTWKRVALTTF